MNSGSQAGGPGCVGSGEEILECGEECGCDLFGGEGGATGIGGLVCVRPEPLSDSCGCAVDLGKRAVGGDNVSLDDAGAGRGEGVVAEAGEDRDATFNCCSEVDSATAVVTYRDRVPQLGEGTESVAGSSAQLGGTEEREAGV
jgi:hypothetical protein